MQLTAGLRVKSMCFTTTSAHTRAVLYNTARHLSSASESRHSYCCMALFKPSNRSQIRTTAHSQLKTSAPSRSWCLKAELTVAASLSGVVPSSGATMSTSTNGDTGAVVVYVTVPSMEVGDKLASGLVESQLAACVNILPGITSVYRWEGKVNKDPELLLVIKTRSALLEQLTTWVKANHPYDECEVIALPIVGGSQSYLKWVMDSTAAPSQ